LSPEQLKRVVKVGDKIHGMRVVEARHVPFDKLWVTVEVPITVEMGVLFGVRDAGMTEAQLKKEIEQRLKDEREKLDAMQTHTVQFKPRR